RPRVELDDGLSRVHREAELQPVLLGPVANSEGRTHRALGVVAERYGRPEHAHDRVADELLHASAEALELRADALVVGTEERANVLGVEALGAGGEAHEISEEDGDDASFLAGAARVGERRAAGIAELRAVGILLSASCAGRHDAED